MSGAQGNLAADVSSNDGKEGHDPGLLSRGDDDAVMALLSSKPKR